MKRKEIKTRLLAEAESIINEVIGQAEGNVPTTIDVIEQAALKAGQEIKERILAELVSSTPTDRKGLACASCGRKMRKKGTRSRWLLTQAGEVQVEREYWYCEECGSGFFPR